MSEHTPTFPAYLMIRDTGIFDDLGGLGQRIYTTAGAGYEKHKYVRADSRDALVAELEYVRGVFEAIHECEERGSPAWQCADEALPRIVAALAKVST